MRSILFCLLSLMLLSSCSVFEGTSKQDENELHYMKNIEEVALEESRSNKATVLQIGDELEIMVSATDADVARPFNQNYSSGQQIRDGSQPSGNQNAIRQPSIVPTYRVSNKGYIDFPVIGKLEASGLTIEQLSHNLRYELTRYILNPSINVKLLNYRISVLGEVKNPGKFIVPDGNATILEALGMAGDLTVFGERSDVLLIRNTNGQISQARIDLTDANFINSPYYDLKQGDVIYVLPNKTQERVAKRDPNNTIYISIASVLVTILALVIRN